VIAYSLRGALGGSGGYLASTFFFVFRLPHTQRLLLREWHSSATIKLAAFGAPRRARLLPPPRDAGAVALYVALDGRFGPPCVIARDLRGCGATALHVVLRRQLALDLPANQSYFAQFSGALARLEHTCSLAIEEQFYLVWPLGILALGERHPTPLAPRRDRGSASRALASALAMAFAVTVPATTRPGLFRHRHTGVRHAAGATVANALRCAPMRGRRRRRVLHVAGLLSAVLLAAAGCWAGSGDRGSRPDGCSREAFSLCGPGGGHRGRVARCNPGGPRPRASASRRFPLGRHDSPTASISGQLAGRGCS